MNVRGLCGVVVAWLRNAAKKARKYADLVAEAGHDPATSRLGAYLYRPLPRHVRRRHSPAIHCSGASARFRPRALYVRGLCGVVVVTLIGVMAPQIQLANERTVADGPGRRSLTFWAPVRLAALGDSLTAGSFAFPDVLDDRAWPVVAQCAKVEVVAGYARSGMTSAEVLPNVTAYDADVLVVLLGTNDIIHQIPLEETIANIDAMVTIANVPRVIIAALPPVAWKDWTIPAADALNSALSATAAEHGWTWIDPWTSLRDGAGHYLPGYTTDNIHPTLAGATVEGLAMRSAILELGHRVPSG